MATLQLGNKTLFTQSGSADPEITSNVNLTNADMSNADMSNANIKTSFSSLDTSASQGPTTDLTNTTLPIFACRAWVHFNGMSYVTVESESHCDIYASGNVSKVVRVGVGLYKIYFLTPMPDTNYCVTGSHVASTNSYGNVGGIGGYNATAGGIETTYVGITYQYHYSSYGFVDQDHLHIAIFR
jgi:hypothetical protein